MSDEKQILDTVKEVSDKNKSFSAHEIVEFLLETLEERDREILWLRNGLSGEKKSTLESIGQKFNLTRERIRQLENAAMGKFKKHKDFDPKVNEVREMVVEILEQHGGFMSFEDLMQEVAKKGIRENAKEISAAGFLLKNYLQDKVEVVKEKGKSANLRLVDLSKEFIDSILDSLEKAFTDKKGLKEFEEIFEKFVKSDFYNENKEKFEKWLSKNNNDLKKIINAYLNAGHKFIKTPMEQWGLEDWPEVKPVRVRGKLYLVLSKIGEPKHFTELAEIINKKWDKSRDIQASTVHNELIDDDRFVLKGRGVYGLKEWESKK